MTAAATDGDARWVVATGNAHKIREIADVLGPLGIGLAAPAELGLALDVDEWGDTFATNAVLKAVAWARATGRTAIADDSGIEVDALGGAPGVHSARFAGPVCDDAANNERLLAELAGTERAGRTARYRCVIAVAEPAGSRPTAVEDTAVDSVPADGRSWVDGMLVTTASGSCEGVIADAARGAGGFGYDPYFELADGRHMAELTALEKAAISHRGAALRALQRRLTAAAAAR